MSAAPELVSTAVDTDDDLPDAVLDRVAALFLAVDPDERAET
jgi:hypothetical protein